MASRSRPSGGDGFDRWVRGRGLLCRDDSVGSVELLQRLLRERVAEGKLGDLA